MSLNKKGILSSGEHAFMLRIWMEDLGSVPLDWRGRIQYINSGEVMFVRDWESMTRFIQRTIGWQADPQKTNHQADGEST